MRANEAHINIDEGLHISLLDYDLAWKRSETDELEELWRSGYSLPEIARTLRRKQIEVFIRLYELGEEGRIDKRVRGIL